MIDKLKRKIYVFRVMKAIAIICDTPMHEIKKRRKTVGLRVIRRFEEINNTKFNPKISSHMMSVSWAAPFEDQCTRNKFKRRLRPVATLD